MHPHDFTLRQLQYIVSVSEHLSFRQAAKACEVSQPSLSAQVAQVEAALGVQLFERSRRHVLTTRPGLAFVRAARSLLTQADVLTLEYARGGGELFEGEAHIGILPTIAPYLLPDLSPALQAFHPKLLLCWHELATHSLLEALTCGTLDLVIASHHDDLTRFAWTPLWDDELLLAAPHHHPSTRSTSPLHVNELNNVQDTLLLLEPRHSLHAQVRRTCPHLHVQNHLAMSLDTLAQMVACGAGLTLLPAMAIPLINRSSQLVVRPLTPTPSRKLVIAWRKESHHQPLADALSACLLRAHEL